MIYDDTKSDFDQFVKDGWPSDIPQDCTKQIDDLDCLQRNLVPEAWCKSCQKFNELCLLYGSHHA